MGSHDLFKKRSEERKRRKSGSRRPKANSYLIITEGQKTEPLYLKGLADKIKKEIGGNVDIYEMPHIDIVGQGCSTGRLVEKADVLINRAKIMYQHVWLVFDKDDFMDFDNAIEAAAGKGYKVAWSNPSFEYWLFLHFEYSDAAMDRKELVQKLDKKFKEFGLDKNGYQKNFSDVYNVVDEYSDGVSGTDIAISNAKRRMSGFKMGSDNPSEYIPGTKVHILVEELKRFLYE